MGQLCPHVGVAGGGIGALKELLRGRPQAYPGKNGEAEATAGSRLVLGHAANRPGCGGVPGRTRPAFSYSPASPSRAAEKWGAGVRLTHPLVLAREAGPLQPRPAPFGCSTRGGAGLPDVGAAAAAAAGGAESEEPWSQAEGRGAAGRPAGLLRAAPAGVRRGTGRPGGGSGTGMHSARLDSFLGQLRWELVRLGSGCGL